MSSSPSRPSAPSFTCAFGSMLPVSSDWVTSSRAASAAITSGTPGHDAAVALDAVAARVQRAVQGGEDLRQPLVGGRLAVDLQQLQRDRVVGAPRHGDVAQRDRAAQHALEGVGEGVAAVADRVDQGAVDVPQDQSHRCLYTRPPPGSRRARVTERSRWVYAGLKGCGDPPIGAVRPRQSQARPMASRVARPPDQFPVAELRAAARAAGEAVDDVDYLQSAVAQLSELVGSDLCSLLVLRERQALPRRLGGHPVQLHGRPSTAPRSAPTWAPAAPPPFRARAIVTSDIREDPKWEPFRAWPPRPGCAPAGRCRCACPAAPCWAPSRPTTSVPGVPDPGQLELAEAHASLVALGLDRLSREERLSESYEAVVVALSSALDVRDEYTGAHSTETARMALDGRLPDGPRQGRPPAPGAGGDAARHRQARDPHGDPARARGRSPRRSGR